MRLPSAIAAGLLLVLHAGQAAACTIPVFRFALDRWEADKFHLVLPASASQDTALQDLLRPLRANGKANLDITTSRDPAVTTASLSHSRASAAPLWSGPLDKAALDALLDSPGRQQIVRNILAGDSAIWVIVDGGSPLDAAEVERVEKRLKFLEQVAALPIQDPDDPDSQLGPGPPLRLKFSSVRVRRDDPAEQVLIRMLAGPKAEFDPATTPFAAVVFGKGRVLGAWPLALLDDRLLEETSLFLVGRCSCRLKNENPGWDMLLNVDWEKALQNAGEQSKKLHSSVADSALETRTASAPAQLARAHLPDTSRPVSSAASAPDSPPPAAAPAPAMPSAKPKAAAVEVVSIRPAPQPPGPPEEPQNTPWLITGTLVMAGLAWWGLSLRK